MTAAVVALRSPATVAGGTVEGRDLPVVYRNHGRAVFRVASAVCGPVLAADVTQEVFEQLWRRPERFDPARGTLRTYLTTIAHFRAIDVARSERSRSARERKHTESTGAPGTRLSDVEAALLKNEETVRIAGAVSRLPPRERAALMVAFYGQRTYRQAAIVLGEPEGTIKSRIRSGLRLLRHALGEHHGPTDALRCAR